MSPYYGIAVRLDGAYEVYMTDDGIRRTPVPSAIYDKPRDAIRYADMRQANISPLRAPGDEPASPPRWLVIRCPHRHRPGVLAG